MVTAVRSCIIIIIRVGPEIYDSIMPIAAETERLQHKSSVERGVVRKYRRFTRAYPTLSPCACMTMHPTGARD